MTEAEKQEYLGTFKHVVATLSPIVKAQAAQAAAFSALDMPWFDTTIYPNGTSPSLAVHRGRWYTGLYTGSLKDAAQQGEQLIQQYSELASYIENTEAESLTLEDVLTRAESITKIYPKES